MNEPRRRPRRRRDASIPLALGASVAAHVVLSIVGWELRGTHVYPTLHGATGRPSAASKAVVILPADPLQEPEYRPKDWMGEEFATGYASNASPGEEVMTARESEADQAFLSRDPQGPGRVGDDPSRNTRRQGEGGSGLGGSLAMLRLTPTTPAQATPFGVAVAIPVPRTKPAVREETHAGEAAPSVPTAPPVPVRVVVAAAAPMIVQAEVQDQSASTAAAPQPGSGDGRAPGSNLPAADPAIESDSESDPFAVLGSYNFHNGRLEVREGRKVKTTRPRILLAGQVDLFAKGARTVVLKVRTDTAGKVTSAEVFKSSGSNDIDLPCRKAMYDWWFAPPRDADGSPIADVFLFTIRIS